MSCLTNEFLQVPEPVDPVETEHRRIVTSHIPAKETKPLIDRALAAFPVVNTYQPPIVWDRAEGYQVFDGAGNCWIDFTSTAVTTNSGHAAPEIRQAIEEHARDGLLAQFNFISEIRIRLAERLIGLAPEGLDKAHLWTVGSEAVESAFRVARVHGRRKRPGKHHILTHHSDFHGWTLAAHQVSGVDAKKDWLDDPDPHVHHLPFPLGEGVDDDSRDWAEFFDSGVERSLGGVAADDVAAVFIETVQGWGSVPLPARYVQRLREWADAHDVLVIFDEVQTGFGRTGRLFGHEHYGVRPDLLCIGKGLSSTLPIAAVLGSAEVLDSFAPGEVTTTHAAHPLSCAAALANIDIITSDGLLDSVEAKGKQVRSALRDLAARYPDHVERVTGVGLLNAIHLRDPQSGEPARTTARAWVRETVKRGVFVFHLDTATLKVCPPLIIPEAALLEGLGVLAESLEATL